MATFDNVTYTFYSDTLGRAVVPSAEDFDALKLENVQKMKSLLPYVTEFEENGIDSAVCMMIEVDYKCNLIKSGKSAESIASESLGGHSVSYGSTQLNKLIEIDAKGTDAQKLDAIKLFCSVDLGVK